MKDITKGFIAGVFATGLSVGPLLYWIFTVRAQFLCPNDECLIRRQKPQRDFKGEMLIPSTDVKRKPKISPEIA